MTDPHKYPYILNNYAINTPAEGEVMLNRPLYHNLMKHDEYFSRYHDYFDELLSEYFESGRFEAVLRQTERLIASYVQKDSTAFCSFADHQLAVDTLEQVCLLRAQSVRSQLNGEIPATIRGQQENPGAKVDASHIRLTDLGDFKDLESASVSFQARCSVRIVEQNCIFRLPIPTRKVRNALYAPTTAAIREPARGIIS